MTSLLLLFLISRVASRVSALLLDLEESFGTFGWNALRSSNNNNNHKRNRNSNNNNNCYYYYVTITMRYYK